MGSSPPQAKRARYVVDNSHSHSNQRRSHRDASFNSFDASPPKDPSHNFLSDRMRDSNHSNYKNQIRHTPQTRMLSKSRTHYRDDRRRRHSSDSYDHYYDAHNTLNITT